MVSKKKQIDAQLRLFNNLVSNIDKKERQITKHLKNSYLDVINMSEHIDQYEQVEKVFNNVLLNQKENDNNNQIIKNNVYQNEM